MNQSLKFFTHSLILVLFALLSGCGKSSPEEESGQQEWAVSAVVAPAEQQSLEEKIFLIGSLASIEEVDLVSEIDARVTGIAFEEGEPVEKGQVLIRLDDRKLAASVAEMEARYALAKANLERAATLVKRETISQQDFDQAEAEADSAKALLDLAREQLEDATIRAPFAGVMTERLISLGQYMSRGQVLASLVEMDPLEVEFNVPERYISQLADQQLVGVSLEAFPEKEFKGRIAFISPRVDRDSRTVLVKARIENPEQRLKPGMFGQLNLVFNTREDALVIPEPAISYMGDQATVVVMNGENRAEFRNVEVGLRQEDKAEIISGLQAGERVVVEGYQKMRPGSLLQVAPESVRYGINPEAQ